MALPEYERLVHEVLSPAPRPQITVHRPWERTFRHGPLPERFSTVFEAARFARQNGATLHAKGEDCRYCDEAVEA